MNRSGIKSYDELRTVDGTLFPTFHAAAKELGLMNDELEWIHAMEEAATYMMPKQLRGLFATILAFGDVKDPPFVWNRMKNEMYDRGMVEERQKVRDSFLGF